MLRIAEVDRRGCLCTVTATDVPRGMNAEDVALPCDQNPSCPTRARNEGRDFGWELLGIMVKLPEKARAELPRKMRQFLKKASGNKNFSHYHRELIKKTLS